MEKAIKLQIRKELNGQQQLNVIKLKGSLISNGYTEIIHINDYDDEFHMNSFETSVENRVEVQNFINTFISNAQLMDTVTIFK
ncbi:hypothetical protein [Flavobacterium ajazii]|uniref:hypothetical protein n=1 Tax=Flavobacterium ajazii TaxID=2692318 RepID=UPI0013D029C5|nr:hypothetical protein [Flavobacterium ajazii]